VGLLCHESDAAELLHILDQERLATFIDACDVFSLHILAMENIVDLLARCFQVVGFFRILYIMATRNEFAQQQCDYLVKPTYRLMNHSKICLFHVIIYNSIVMTSFCCRTSDDLFNTISS
jgi:hypothetical protein